MSSTGSTRLFVLGAGDVIGFDPYFDQFTINGELMEANRILLIDGVGVRLSLDALRQAMDLHTLATQQAREAFTRLAEAYRSNEPACDAKPWIAMNEQHRKRKGYRR